MRRKGFAAIAFALALPLAALSTEAAERTRRQAAEPPPPQFQVNVPTRAMTLTRVAMGISAGTTIGQMMPKCTLIGAPGFSTVPLYPEHAFPASADRDFKSVFANEARAAGYRLPESIGNLFETQGASQAELNVGVGITGLTANGCTGAVLIVKMQEAEVSITLDWQVFDPLEKKILFRATNTGHSKIQRNEYSGAIVMEATRAAFQDAAKAILADPAFVAAVTDPRAAPPSVSQNPTSPSGAVSAQIAQVPLRTKPFREQVQDLQKHVVTILTPGSTGSGFYIADGLLLTNDHVIRGFTDVKISFLGGREISGHVIASNARRDIALVRTESAGIDGLAIRLENPELTSPVFVIGSPLDPKYAGSISAGIVSAFRAHEYGPMIQSDVAVTHGNSGGPMFDEKGNVIGITDLGIPGANGEPTAVNLFIPIGDALKVLNIELGLKPGSAPVVTNAPPALGSTQTAALSAPPSGAPAPRQIQVSMYPAAGPVKDGGHSNALAGVVEGVGTSGTFTFARPDGVACNGRWTTLQSKPQSGSLVDKYQNVTGLSASVSGMVGGLAVGACSNAASFQAEYYAVPGADSGFGVATDSDGNVYKLIF